MQYDLTSVKTDKILAYFKKIYFFNLFFLNFFFKHVNVEKNCIYLIIDMNNFCKINTINKKF